jgi:hypothetical protein
MNIREGSGNDIATFRYVLGRGMVPPSALMEPLEPTVAPTLPINVVFTDFAATTVALTRAAELAVDLTAETRIIVPHVVPYPLPLECPAVPLEFTCKRLITLAGMAGADPYINVYLCRDVIDLLLKLLPAPSIAVLGTGKRWLFPTKTHRIARVLRNKGCAVILV